MSFVNKQITGSIIPQWSVASSTIEAPVQNFGTRALKIVGNGANCVKNYWNGCSKETRAAAAGIGAAVPAYTLGAGAFGVLSGAVLAGSAALGVGGIVYRHLHKQEARVIAQKTEEAAAPVIAEMALPSFIEESEVSERVEENEGSESVEENEGSEIVEESEGSESVEENEGAERVEENEGLEIVEESQDEEVLAPEVSTVVDEQAPEAAEKTAISSPRQNFREPLSKRCTFIPSKINAATAGFWGKLLFKIAAIFRAFAVLIGAVCLAIAAGVVILPCRKLGYELWRNSLFCFSLLQEIACASFDENLHFNSSRLLTGEEGSYQSEFSWYLNLGLLRSAYEKTDDPKLKEQIKFMAANYLAKAAPYHTHQLRYLDPRFDLLSQVPPPTNLDYHRGGACHENRNLSEPFNRELALGVESPLIFTDTDELSEVFTLGYDVFTPEEDWASKMETVLTARFAEAQDAKEAFKKPLKFLFDLTSQFQDCIYDKNKEKEALAILDKFRADFERTIKEVALLYPDLDPKEISNFIRDNTVCITRVKFDEIAGIKILPLDPKATFEELIEKHEAFYYFIDVTGVFINRINYFRHVLQEQSFKDTRYEIESPADVHYFPEIEDLTRNFVSFDENEKGYVQILGNGTIELLKGWTQEIGQDRWEEINQNPVVREILDAILYKIKMQFAAAQLWKDDFSKFTQAIELIHHDLAMVLELTAPFKEEDFSSIYSEALQLIPDSLRPHLKAGLGKTAVNVYTAVNNAIARTVESPVRAVCDGLYFEEVGYLGNEYGIEELLANDEISKVDLYATQFNSNIQIEHYRVNYQEIDVVGELRRLLNAKPDTKHLTVSVDCTIDYLNSAKVNELLMAFESEILEGKLNFVFLRSGQKFEMLGMDNYYGSPYYIINNGGDQWEAFNDVMTKKVYKTDSLSQQWFCLAYRYIPDLLDAYRDGIFKNTREILHQIPSELKPKGNPLEQRVRINTVADSMIPTFIDVKITGAFARLRGHLLIGRFHHNCGKKGIKSDSRASFGFYHPNVNNITPYPNDGSTSLRFTPGIDPIQNQELIKFFKEELAVRL